VTTNSTRFKTLGPISRTRADKMLATGEPTAILYALLRLSLHGPDFEYAERKALEHVRHPDAWVRRNAATALGHVARVHGSIDVDTVMRTLVSMLNDPEACGWADDALDDVEMYMQADRSHYGAARKAVPPAEIT
jgi:hypothetical protein